MKALRVGAVIAAKRKEKGMTQEELAAYLGVSKPAVSKWESEQCYPDIALLPVMASLFNVSVDQLLDYQPQMTREDIRKLYRRLSHEFSINDFDSCRSAVRETTRKYFSCYPLLYCMGLLLFNQAAAAGDADKTAETLREAADLFLRVEQASEDPGLSKQARHTRAAVALALGDPTETVDLLENMLEIPSSTEVLLATACMQKNQPKQAEALLQRSVYLSLMGLFGAYTVLLPLYTSNPDKMRRWLGCLSSVIDGFAIRHLHPIAVLQLDLQAAMCFAAAGEKEDALLHLEHVADILQQPGVFPLQLRGDAMFDKIDGLFESLELGAEPPRDDRSVKESLRSLLTNNSVFEPVASDPRFSVLVKKIETALED